jgi:predicted signal transduction protein with EAL and GGDEF domain
VGGDDFALILPGTDGAIAPRSPSALARSWPRPRRIDRRISCSAGVASYPEDARDGATLLQLANGALRWAKSSGRGQTRRYDPQSVSVPTDAEERAEIEGLLDREQPLIPFFQPLVSLSTGRVLGFEALSRFPDRPAAAPSSWFAQAARCGLGAAARGGALRAALVPPGPAGGHVPLDQREPERDLATPRCRRVCRRT